MVRNTYGRSFSHWGLHFLLRNMGTRCSLADSKNMKNSYFCLEPGPVLSILHNLCLTTHICGMGSVTAYFAEMRQDLPVSGLGDFCTSALCSLACMRTGGALTEPRWRPRPRDRKRPSLSSRSQDQSQDIIQNSGLPEQCSFPYPALPTSFLPLPGCLPEAQGSQSVPSEKKKHCQGPRDWSRLHKTPQAGPS